jgi:hypothetical protein
MVNKKINKKGGLSVLSLVSFLVITMALTTGIGFMIGYANQEYNATFNTNVSGTDLTDASSFDYFINATNIYNVTPNGTLNITDTNQSLLEGSISLQGALTGWWQILLDIIEITPLEQYGGFLKSLISLLGGILITILFLQFIFNRSLT